MLSNKEKKYFQMKHDDNQYLYKPKTVIKDDDCCFMIIVGNRSAMKTAVLFFRFKRNISLIYRSKLAVTLSSNKI